MYQIAPSVFEDAVGIVEKTDNAVHNIDEAQYVIWKGRLYTASTDIAIGDALSDSNLTAVTGGGLNDLSSKLEDGVTVSNLTTTSGSFKTLTSFSVTTPGNYILTVTAPFAAGSGVRILLVDVSETDTNNARNSVLAEGRATLQKTMMFSLSTSDTVYIRAYQNSGSNMSVGAYYRLMRIG